MDDAVNCWNMCCGCRQQRNENVLKFNMEIYVSAIVNSRLASQHKVIILRAFVCRMPIDRIGTYIEYGQCQSYCTCAWLLQDMS